MTYLFITFECFRLSSSITVILIVTPALSASEISRQDRSSTVYAQSYISHAFLVLVHRYCQIELVSGVYFNLKLADLLLLLEFTWTCALCLSIQKTQIRLQICISVVAFGNYDSFKNYFRDRCLLICSIVVSTTQTTFYPYFLLNYKRAISL